ncbi:Bug family tripartite tricarboxylate transporter substrate binding protein [Pseudorhodoferax soli]|uniref:Tripartite-type tricarboxylate transporter receptor subunit TctC n=1 Tax=Pseudorhodoferax soli TaxID=545864 RepID=A0A368XLS5_9BURK|nr:tripartite tricarboxylate transporter substrate binding protein [Pseudorhodoferax soli]RCW68805.1 tripartite-type tricarboxylate transporter receptor subunit TctC [Pseudorhodoferax soli]
MHTRRRAFVAAAVAWPLARLHAQAWPSRSITMLVPSTAGGVVDISARLLQPGLSTEVGQPIVVENRPGGGGHIAAQTVARATPDGYTQLYSAGSILISGVVRNLPYAPMSDLVPVCRITMGGFLLLVPANSPFKTLAELIAFGRAHPGKLSFGSSSVGNSTHIAGEMLNLLAGVQAVHVPYRGNVQSLTDLAGGRIDFAFDSRSPAAVFLRAGQIRPIAVTNTERQADYPDLPAIAEQAPGYGIEGWTGLFVPARTGPDIVARLGAAAQRVVSDPAVVQRFVTTGGAPPAFLGPADALAYMQLDHERTARVVRQANITAG